MLAAKKTGLEERQAVRVIVFEYGHQWPLTSTDTSTLNLERATRWLRDDLDFDVYLVGNRLDPALTPPAVALLDLSRCWFPQFETWAAATVLAVHRRNSPGLARRLRDRAQHWAAAAAPHRPCAVSVDVGANAAAFALDRRDPPSAWRDAALRFARRHTLERGAGCDDQRCVVDRLLAFALYECGFSSS